MRHFINVAHEKNGRHVKDTQQEYPTAEQARIAFQGMKHGEGVYWLGLYQQETQPWMSAIKIDSWCR